MPKLFSAALLALCVCTGAAYARGGAADAVPLTNFTDLPDYRPTGPLGWTTAKPFRLRHCKSLEAASAHHLERSESLIRNCSSPRS